MTVDLGDAIKFVAAALLVGLLGSGFGIFFVAPRLSRLAERTDEEPGGRDD